MGVLAPSALLTDHGRHVHLRLQGRLYECSQEELRTLLGLPPGSPGLGISIVRKRFRFEFVGDNQTVEMTAEQLHHRLGKQLTSKT